MRNALKVLLWLTLAVSAAVQLLPFHDGTSIEIAVVLGGISSVVLVFIVDAVDSNISLFRLIAHRLIIFSLVCGALLMLFAGRGDEGRTIAALLFIVAVSMRLVLVVRQN